MKNREVYCLNAISGVGTAQFREGYRLVASMENAAGVLVRSSDMREMSFPPTLRAIARAGAGVNNIPIERCAAEGIVVFNTPGANANGVKELVVAALLLASRDIVGGIEWVKRNVDDADIAKSAEKAKKAFAGSEILGKKLAVIGLGAIGVLVANIASSLGMEVYGYDPYISVNAAWNLNRSVHRASSLDELYALADYITVHVPALDATRGMLNAAAFEKMKDGVRVLNFSRDTLVDDDAMAAALESGKVRVYVTDFPNSKTVRMKGAVVIPHLGASTEESEDNCAVMAVQQLQDYLDNGNIKNSVNYPDCDAGVCHSAARVAVLHKNIPNMLSQITAAMGNSCINIENMLNKSKGAYAYTLMDLENEMTADAMASLKAIDGILRIRKVK